MPVHAKEREASTRSLDIVFSGGKKNRCNILDFLVVVGGLEYSMNFGKRANKLIPLPTILMPHDLHSTTPVDVLYVGAGMHTASVLFLEVDYASTGDWPRHYDYDIIVGFFSFFSFLSFLYGAAYNF